MRRQENQHFALCALHYITPTDNDVAFEVPRCILARPGIQARLRLLLETARASQSVTARCDEIGHLQLQIGDAATELSLVCLALQTLRAECFALLVSAPSPS
jgi:hypothetical protein